MPQPKQPHYIILLDPSANGTKQIERFFDCAPLDDISYVIDRHVPHALKSSIAELIAVHGKLQMAEAQAGVRIESNKVYFTPIDKYTTIRDGRLHLNDTLEKSSARSGINTLISSMPAAAREDAIGIIFSGTHFNKSKGMAPLPGKRGTKQFAIEKTNGRHVTVPETGEDLNNCPGSNIDSQLFVNADLVLTKCSPGAQKHINVHEADIGTHLNGISTDVKFDTILSDVKEVFDHGAIITKEVEANNGKWYEVTILPHTLGTDGETDEAIISFNDITRLKLIQSELDKANTRLLSINADLDNFVHTASHDLLGPLANIMLTIDVMNQLKVSADPQLNKFLGIINGSVKMFVELVREMGTIANIENEMLARNPVNVNQLLDELTASMQNQILSTGALIIRNISVTHIYFSKKNLRSILYNLISNAIKFKSADRSLAIAVSTKEEDGYTILRVEDNGVGIHESEFSYIFRMHGRLHKKVEGQGIGLYLIKKILNAAGGKVTVESEPGRGSIFTIYFKLETKQ